MNDNELPCEFCGNPVELSDWVVYREATGDGICGDCYMIEWSRGKFPRGTDARVGVMEQALEEADDLATYLDERLRELDEQYEAEGGK